MAGTVLVKNVEGAKTLASGVKGFIQLIKSGISEGANLLFKTPSGRNAEILCITNKPGKFAAFNREVSVGDRKVVTSYLYEHGSDRLFIHPPTEFSPRGYINHRENMFCYQGNEYLKTQRLFGQEPEYVDLCNKTHCSLEQANNIMNYIRYGGNMRVGF